MPRSWRAAAEERAFRRRPFIMRAVLLDGTGRPRGAAARRYRTPFAARWRPTPRSSSRPKISHISGLSGLSGSARSSSGPDRALCNPLPERAPCADSRSPPRGPRSSGSRVPSCSPYKRSALEEDVPADLTGGPAIHRDDGGDGVLTRRQSLVTRLPSATCRRSSAVVRRAP